MKISDNTLGESLQTLSGTFRVKNEKTLAKAREKMEQMIVSLRKNLMEQSQHMGMTRVINQIIKTEYSLAKYNERSQFTDLCDQIKRGETPAYSKEQFEGLMAEGRPKKILPDPIRLAYLFRFLGFLFLFRSISRCSSLPWEEMIADFNQ